MTKAAAAEEVHDTTDRQGLTPPPTPPSMAATTAAVKPKRAASKKAVKVEEENDFDPDAEMAAESAEEHDSAPAAATPKKKRTPKKAVKVEEEKDFDPDAEMAESGEEGEPAPTVTPKRKRTPKKVKAEEDVKPVVDGEEGEAVTPKKRRRKPTEPIVYEIPDVEKLPTTYKGRLGFACLNTILRTQKPPVFCSRTCRIDTIKKEGMEHLKELGRQNMADLYKLIEWNVAHHIYFMRMSSEMFPFAAHPEYKYSLDYAEKELKEAGDLAKKHGVRLTTHPGQFTQLGSPRPQVVNNAILDLSYHCEMMDRMGLDQDSVMIIHGGGVYGDKVAAMANFKVNYARLPENVKGRLVLENDELCYNADDLLPVCEELNIPFVFDYHHDSIFPSSQTPKEMMPRILATWTRKGIKCKQHLSEERRGAVTIMERRAHADRCQRLPADLPDDVDLMIEAKDKEQAVMHLFRIYDLQPVIHDDLRPPVEEETTQTGGRKSNKRAKLLKEKAEAAKLAKEATADGARPEGLEPVEDGETVAPLESQVADEPPALTEELVEALPAPKKRAARKAKAKKEEV